MKTKNKIKPVSVCAWCDNKEQKEKEAKAQGFEITHGICKKCAKIYFN
jgi:DNA polymerase III alpha subunit (gram-positive type)